MVAHLTESGNRKYYRVSIEDDEWLDGQTEGVRKLWRELSKADPYGTKEGVPFKTQLKNTAFFTAKKKIEEYGAFKIFSVSSENDSRMKEWRVFNKHGANMTSYWKPSVYTNDQEKMEYVYTEKEYVYTESEFAQTYGVSPTTPSGSSLPLIPKSNNKQQQNSEAAVFSSLVLEEESTSSPTNSPDNLSNEIQHLSPAKLSVIQTTPVTQISVLNDNPLSGQKSSAPAARHITSQSNQDAPQATPPRQTSNPTLDQFETALDAFSLELEPSLENLLSALKDLGRLSEFKDVLGLKDLIRSKPTQVAVDAIDHVTEKLSSVKVLGAYLRKALNDSYKPTGDKVGVSTKSVSREEPKPAPEALEDFLSEEVLERFRRANLGGQYLQMCEFRLKEYWQCGDSKHEQIIDVMRQMQKNNLPFVSV